MYENGTFVEQNYDTALSYYKNSAAQNNIMAIGEMAFMKDNGYGMPMNKEEAEKYTSNWPKNATMSGP